MLDTLHAKSEGTGSWRFDFTEPFEIKEGQVVQVDDVTFQHSFPTIDENSQRVYVFYEHGLTKHAQLVNLPIGVFNADEVAARLQTTLNNGYRWNGSNSQFVVSITDGVISVAVNHVATGPDLSGNWEVFNGSNAKQRDEVVTKLNSLQFSYEQGGVRQWVVDEDDFDNTPPRQLTLTETRPDGSTQVYTWDDATRRLNGGGGFYF